MAIKSATLLLRGDDHIISVIGCHASLTIRNIFYFIDFLLNTLNKFLSDDVLKEADDCKRELLSKIGGSQGQGPDGLGAIERLERLGRIYVMCLGD